MIYKRGSTYWTKFQHSGRMIYKSTGQTSRTKARQVEARLRSELAMGHYGILERKSVPTLAEFIRERIEPKVKESKLKESSDIENGEQRRQKRFRWLRTALKPLSTHAIGRLPLDKITSEHVSDYGMDRETKRLTIGTVNQGVACSASYSSLGCRMERHGEIAEDSDGRQRTFPGSRGWGS